MAISAPGVWNASPASSAAQHPVVHGRLSQTKIDDNGSFAKGDEKMARSNSIGPLEDHMFHTPIGQGGRSSNFLLVPSSLHIFPKNGGLRDIENL